MPLERLLSQPATDTTSGQEGAAGKGIGEAAACGEIEMDGGDPLYLHDWSLPQNLGLESPLLAGKFRVWFSAGTCRSFLSVMWSKIWQCSAIEAASRVKSGSVPHILRKLLVGLNQAVESTVIACICAFLCTPHSVIRRGVSQFRHAGSAFLPADVVTMATGAQVFCG